MHIQHRSSRRRLRNLSVATVAGAVLTLGAPLLASQAGANPGPSTYVQMPNHGPEDLTIDTQGNFCVAGSNQHTVFGVDTSQNVNAFATDASSFSYTWGTAVGPDGNLYVSNNGGQGIYQVSPNGNISLFATIPVGNAADLAWSPNGNLYVGYYFGEGEHGIDQITPQGIVTGLLTNGSYGPGVAFEPNGTLVTEYQGDGGYVYYMSVNPNTSSASYLGSSNFVDWNDPSGIAIGASGTVYVADQYGYIWQILTNNSVNMFASVEADFVGLAFDSHGTLYAADWAGGAIYSYAGTDSSYGGYLFHNFSCGDTSPTMPLNLKVKRHLGTVTGTWLPQPGSWFLCTLLAGQSPTSVTVRTTLDTCTFTGLNPGGYYGIRVQAQNNAGVSPIAQALAPPPQAIQIKCAKGTQIKRITGFNPRCPIGWHRV